MSTPHYNNGSLLLKDSNTSNWYYVSVVLLDGVPYISPAQQNTSVPAVPTFSETVVIQAVDGRYYRISLYSDDGGNIYTSNILLTTVEPSFTVLLSPDSGATQYQLTLDVDDQGNNYLTIIPYEAPVIPTTNLCSPWRLISPVSSKCVREIVVRA